MLAIFTIGLIMLICGIATIKDNTSIGAILIILGGAFLSAMANIGY